MAFWAAHELLTIAQAAVTLEIFVADGVGLNDDLMQLQALEILNKRGPFWFSWQADAAYDGIAVAGTLAEVKVAQNVSAA